MCGGISYIINDAPASGVTGLTAAELYISSSGLISIWTNVVGTIGVHTVTVTARLVSYTAVTITKSFTLTVVDPCTTTTLVSSGSLSD